MFEVSCIALLFACSGDIDPNGGEPGGPNGGAANGTSGGGAATGGAGASGGGAASGAAGSAGSSNPGDPRIGKRVWRLSPEQFNQEVQRLFGAGAPAVMIPESAAENGITNIADNAVIDLGNASIFDSGARAIASWVVDQGDAATRCSPYGDEACVDSFLGWCPESAFRRAVSASEIAELRSLFDDLRADYDYDYAFSGMVRAILLSPDFLYRVELAGDGSVMQPFEIANALAFAITDESPDAELITAAESQDLADPDVREMHARRLMAKSERLWQGFFWQWLHMSTLYSQGDEVGLPTQLVDQMEEEYREFLRNVIVEDRGTLHDVLSASYSYMRPELAEHYGVDHPGSGLARVELDPSERGGLLTQGAWLVSHGKRGKDNVVRRGMNIYKDAMCNNALRPPPGVDVQAELLKLVGPDATVRETVDARGMAAGCGNCHRVPDPIGMIFESYTSDGAFQDTYPSGDAVDTFVDVEGIGQFEEASVFSAALAADENIQMCVVQRVLQFMLGIDLGSPRMAAVSQAAFERFAEHDTSFEELLVAIVRHPAFVERIEEAP